MRTVAGPIDAGRAFASLVGALACDRPRPARDRLAGLDDDQAEAARQLVKLGLAACFAGAEAARLVAGLTAPVDSTAHEALWLRIADRVGQAHEALASLDDAEAALFWRIARDQAEAVVGVGMRDYLRRARGP